MITATAPGKVVLWAAEAKPADFGELAPLVVELAAAGDALAIKLMRESGAEASLLGQALLARGVKRIALSGGFAPSLRPWLAGDVQASLVEPAGDPVAGQHLGILLIELGVGLTVAAVMVIIFFNFCGRRDLP